MAFHFGRHLSRDWRRMRPRLLLSPKLPPHLLREERTSAHCCGLCDCAHKLSTRIGCFVKCSVEHDHTPASGVGIGLRHADSGHDERQYCAKAARLLLGNGKGTG